MTPAEIEQCQAEWTEAETTRTPYARAGKRESLYRKWFYPLLIHARTIEAERAGAQPLPNQYPRGPAPRCPSCGYTKADAAFHGDHHLCDGKIPEVAAVDCIDDDRR